MHEFKNKSFIINRILTMNNLNYGELLFYGLTRNLIDDLFCVEFAVELMMRAHPLINEPFYADMAGYTMYEYHKASEVFAKKFEDKDRILLQQGQYYNKIWFYLITCSDMNDQGILR